MDMTVYILASLVILGRRARAEPGIQEDLQAVTSRHAEPSGSRIASGVRDDERRGAAKW